MVEVTIKFVINLADYEEDLPDHTEKSIRELVNNQILNDFNNWKNARYELFPEPQVEVRQLID